ncbi:MAG: S1 RNA-binding domain-containing protein, partial [Candidatus Tectomicrobia bacterium]|nr:S1 RNA-binding domain-containing protein [Candidatus Tectomicrobia bacterium]
QQAAGFLRIKDGQHILDSTAVHPETYAVVERMAASLAVPVATLAANAELIHSLDLHTFVDEHVGVLTLQDIREELLKPGRDPRAQFVMPQFRDDVTSLEHLQEGMILEGMVSNVTNFGAFVDIGVHQDGLVHISELSQRYVRDPRDVVQVGQVVKVRVLSVDVALQRISLSMKSLRPAAEGPPTETVPVRDTARRDTAAPARRRRRRVAPPAPRPQVTAPEPEAEAEPEPAMDMAEKLRALQARFQGAGRS